MGRRAAFLLVLASGSLVAGCDGPKPQIVETRSPVVVVSPAITDYVTDFEDFTGRTDAVYSVDVRARVTGYLEKVHFKDGDEVKEKDLLFEIDPRPYDAELARAEATILQGQAHLNRLDADFRRAKNLFARGNISREEMDKFAGDRAEAEASVGIVLAARDLAKLNVEFTKIRAPISGRLSRRLRDPGNLVNADDTILTSIVSLDPMYVYFDIDERTLLKIRRLIREGRVKTRQEAEVPVLVGLSDEEGFPHRGTINFSDNKVDPSTGTLRARGIIENPKLRGTSSRVLSPGLFTRVRLPIGGAHKETLIPEDAIATDQGRKYLYIVKDEAKKPAKGAKGGGGIDHVVVDRTVTLGPSHGGLRVIQSGLKANELVVVRGHQRVRPGTKVETRLWEDAPKLPSSETTLLPGPPTPVATQALGD